MKKYITLIFVILIVLILSCEKEPYINLGFDSPINTNSNGLVIAHISRNVNRVYLSGYVSLSEGEVEVSLLNSNGFVVYSRTIIAPDKMHINKTFDANHGYWKLKYTSRSGIGEIDLHIHNF
jgi:hypothetical protein